MADDPTVLGVFPIRGYTEECSCPVNVRKKWKSPARKRTKLSLAVSMPETFD